MKSVNGLGGHPLQRYVEQIFAVGPDRLAVMSRFCKRACTACRGKGYRLFLQRPGATEKEPRTARICSCAQRRINAEAARLLQKAGEKHDEVLRHEG